MTGKQIQQLVRQLDPDHDYFQLTSKDKGTKRRLLTPAERLAMADRDAGFLWHLAATEARAGQPLPAFVSNSAALRANSYLLASTDHPDVHIALVQSWGLPAMSPTRNLLRALCCSQDISLPEIAEQCGVELDAVRLFEQLRWNIRDRMKERLYIAQLLYPNTRFSAQSKRPIEQEDIGLRLCQLGYEQGFRAVLQAAGPMLLEDGTQAVQAASQKALSTLSARAGLGVQMGLTSKADNPELSLAKDLDLLAAPDPARSGDALSGMSMSRDINKSFMAIIEPERKRRLAVQRGLDEESAASAQSAQDESAA